MPRNKRWFELKKVWLPALLLGLSALFVFFGLKPVVEWRTREALKLFEPGYRVTFEGASLQPARLNYALTGLKVVKPSAGGDALPWISVERMEMGVVWRELLKLHLVAALDIEKARLNLIAAHDEARRQLESGIPDFSARLLDAFPLTIDRVQLKDAEVKFTDRSNPDFPTVWFHAIDGTVENLSTRAALTRGQPTAFALAGTVQDSGQISAFMTADPLAKGLFFSGRASVTDFELAELKDTLSSETGLQVASGTLDVFAEFDCRAGKLTGSVKPLLKNVTVVQGKPGQRNAIDAVLADSAVKILSDRVAGRDAVATVISLRGDLGHPALQLGPAVAGVIRNAFVIGVSEGYQGLAAPVAEVAQRPLRSPEGLARAEFPRGRPVAEARQTGGGTP